MFHALVVAMRVHARVLVAEDDLELLATVADVLESWGAEVVRANSGAELIEGLAREGPFSLVVTDIGMPWMSGLHVMHSARHAGLATPVIIITGLTDERLTQQVRALGSEAVLLRKPFGLGELESAVSKLLGGGTAVKAFRRACARPTSKARCSSR
jgi:DNA-binding response OmpR family regulator